jgi:hypothetical protein
MAQEFKTVSELREFAKSLRGRAGVHPVHASVYRDFVVDVAVYAAALPELADTDERFLKAACAGIDGLGDDCNRRVYVPAETLFRLSCFNVPSPSAVAAEPEPLPEPVEDFPPLEPADVEPAAAKKPKRRKKVKS